MHFHKAQGKFHFNHTASNTTILQFNNYVLDNDNQHILKV